MSPKTEDGGGAKKRRLAPGDRQEIYMLYEDVTIADIKKNGGWENGRCLSLLAYLLWSDEGYGYLGQAIDEVARLGWLIQDFAAWTRKTCTRVVTKGETGNPHLDDVIKRTRQVRRLLKLKNPDPFPEQGSHRGVALENMSFSEHRQKGEEYYEEARALLRKGDWHTGVYLIGVREGHELAQKPSPAVLDMPRQIEPPNGGDGVPPVD